ncbi:MAG: hypothetical protein LUC43_05605 [Burkholderiales bacterium]|nr:hypothetical protein [Burkholderiales bacterium]
MKLSLKTKLAAAFVAVAAFMPLQTSSVLAQSSTPVARPIFGFIVLDKTTVADVQKELQEKKCVAEYSYVYGIQFDGTCVGLPHDPQVNLLLPKDKIPEDQAEARAMHREPPEAMLNLPINVVQVGFWEYAKNVFDQYVEFLQKDWGEPKQCTPQKWEASWECDGVQIKLRDDKLTYTKMP